MDPKDLIHYLDICIENRKVEILKLEAKIEVYREIKNITEEQMGRDKE